MTGSGGGDVTPRINFQKGGIAGPGLAPFGEHAGRTGRDLFAEAGLDAVAAPYATAVVGFGPVRLTGLVRDVDEEPAPGAVVGVDVAKTVTAGDRVVTFRPR